MEPEKKQFKILCIDGGGIKGLYSAKVLQHFEEYFGCQISDYFDMICGTSTGGLIALGLSLKIPAKELVDFYINKGPLIFPERRATKALRAYDVWRQLFSGGKFSDTELRAGLEEVFGEHVIGDSNNYLCIPSYLVTDARPWIFKKDFGKLNRDDRTRYVDVGLATTAAPTYFPMAELEIYNNRQFIDGGVWANNPTMVGYVEAMTYFVGPEPEKEFDRLSILSLSSLSITGGKPLGLKRERAFIDWRDELFETSMTGQSKFIDYFMANVNKFSNCPIDYVRIPSAAISALQESDIQLDVASEKALKLILSKGSDQGLLYEKMDSVADFFKAKKLSNIKTVAKQTN